MTDSNIPGQLPRGNFVIRKVSMGRNERSFLMLSCIATTRLVDNGGINLKTITTFQFT